MYRDSKYLYFRCLLLYRIPRKQVTALLRRMKNGKSFNAKVALVECMRTRWNVSNHAGDTLLFSLSPERWVINEKLSVPLAYTKFTDFPLEEE